MLGHDDATAAELLRLAQEDVEERWRTYEHMAALRPGDGGTKS